MNKQTTKRYFTTENSIEDIMMFIINAIMGMFDNTANYYREERRKGYVVAELSRNTVLKLNMNCIEKGGSSNVIVDADIDTGNTKNCIEATINHNFRMIDFQCIKTLERLGDIYLPRFELHLNGNNIDRAHTSFLGFIDNELMSKCDLIEIKNTYFMYLKVNDNLFGTDNTQTCPAEIRIDNCIFKNCNTIGLFNRTGFKKISITNCRFTEWITKLDNLFSNNEYLQEVDITGTDFDRVLSMKETFMGCPELKEIKGLNGIDTSRCVTFESCFEECRKLESIDLSKWSTKNTRSFKKMFNRTYNLNYLNINNFDLADRDVTQMLYTNILRTKDLQIIHNNGSKAIIKNLDIVDIEYQRVERFIYYSAATEIGNIEGYNEKEDCFEYSNPNSAEVNKLFEVYEVSKEEFEGYTIKEIRKLYNAIINICNFSRGSKLFDIKSNYRVNSNDMLKIGAMVLNYNDVSDEEFSKHVTIKQFENNDELKKTFKTRLLKRDMLGVNEYALDLGIAYMVASSEAQRVELFIGMEETR